MAENTAYTYVGAFVDELVRAGVTHLCLCPGSRSTPLALSAARHPGMKVWTLVDERSAGFFALGMAKALRAPVALLSTSGTAAANFFPAVVEARYGRIPLVVLTADRPHELRESGAPQTIDQIRLYGAHAKWFQDMALPEAGDLLLRYVRAAAGQAAATARDDPAGPVHLNFPLREPLVPVPDPDRLPAPEERSPEAWEGRAAGAPYARAHSGRRMPDAELVRALACEIAASPLGLIVCGPYDDPALPGAVAALACAAGYPVLADPLSQVRCGTHDRRFVVDAYDPLLRAEGVARALEPQLILRFGGTPTSKPLMQYMERHACARQIVADGGSGWLDPTRVAAEFVHADPALLCRVLAADPSLRTAMDRVASDHAVGDRAVGDRVAEGHAGPGSTASARNAEPAAPTRPAYDPAALPWAARWLEMGSRARRAINQRLESVDEPFEGKVFSELCGLLPDGSVLYVGNSMPVRDLDSFFPGTERAIRFLGNRGASGIDGLVSSALGVAAGLGASAGPGESAALGASAGPGSSGPVVLVLGDLAFYHDMNGLLAAKLHRLNATVVLINNDGGGIFSFLPQADYPEHFEMLFGTPHGLEFRHAVAMYGAEHRLAETWDEFRAGVSQGMGVGGLSIVEIRTRRDRNVVLHREMWSAVAEALRARTPARTV